MYTCPRKNHTVSLSVIEEEPSGSNEAQVVLEGAVVVQSEARGSVEL